MLWVETERLFKKNNQHAVTIYLTLWEILFLYKTTVLKKKLNLKKLVCSVGCCMSDLLKTTVVNGKWTAFMFVPSCHWPLSEFYNTSHHSPFHTHSYTGGRGCIQVPPAHEQRYPFTRTQTPNSHQEQFGFSIFPGQTNNLPITEQLLCLLNHSCP